MSPLTLFLICSSGIAILSLSRKHALMVMLAAITLIPMSSISIGPASFYPARIIISFGFLRAILKNEFLTGPINCIDKTIIMWSVAMILTRVLVHRTDISVISRFGETYDVIGVYFLYRFYIRDIDDMLTIFKAAALVFCILVVLMLYEKIKCFNLFSLLGGVPPFPSIRDGRIRCQGPFLHSILAGTVPATSFTWFLALYMQKDQNKKFALVGLLTSIIIVALSSSSGPIMSLFFVIIAFSSWKLRKNMKSVRYWIFSILIVLQIVMNSSIWYLIAKIDLTGSSTGWHRAELIDTTIRHFNEWWIAGTDYTRHWMPTGVTWSEQHTDITNQYIKNGVNGGIVTLALFIMLIVYGFSLIGKTIKKFEMHSFSELFIIWALGATLFSHTITFLSVRYFDQSFSYFFLLLAMIGGMHNYYSSIHKEK